jgi:HTH-type transcriptional regulator, competence development regulator
MTFGEVIRQQREARGLTLFDVAAEVGISIGYLSRIERDREKPPGDELIRSIATKVGLPQDEAFAAARRLPPDLKPRAREMFALYRNLSR